MALVGRGLLTGVRDQHRALGKSAGVSTGVTSCGIREHEICRKAKVPALGPPSVPSMLLPRLGLNKLCPRTGVDTDGALRLPTHQHEDMSSVIQK